MSVIVRIILWALLIVVPGGVVLLPLLVGDAAARRKREEKRAGVGSARGQAHQPADSRVAATATLQ